MLLMLNLAASLCTVNPTFSNQTDEISLLAFKDSIIEDPHGALSSWNNSVNVCQWHGVKCGRRHQRVVELDLRSQRLVGSISPFIGNLSFLSQLSRLQNLNFSSNALQGEIPSNLSHCLDLRVINLSENDLVGKIPAAIGSFSKLKILYVFSNSLYGIIPPSLGNLSLLEQIVLKGNKLEGTIPESIGNLRHLKHFGINENRISGTVPPSIYNISTLLALIIVDNQLTGSLPWDIGLTLPNLERISVAENQFTGRFPPSFSNASRIGALDLSVNKFFGPVPVDLGRRMNDLWWMNLGDNNLGTGDAGDLSFVDSLTNCTKLKALGLQLNGFGGVLPNSITNLSTQLTYLHAGGNQFVGNIPPGISNYVNLLSLSLQKNRLSGSIPFNIGMLQNLQAISLAENQLSGSIPESIGNLTQLFDLDLQLNNLTGNLPQSLENIKRLQILNLSYNHLTLRSLDIFLFFQCGIHILSLPSHLLSQFCQFFNNMSGTIPIDLEKLSILENLNLSFNNLEGEMPLKGGFNNTSVISIVGNMNLCGGIPELRLPACPIPESKKHNNRKVIIIIITVALCLVKKRHPKPPPGEEFFRVSYDDLLKATDGFSSNNLLGVGSFGSLGASKSFITECEALRQTKHRNLLKIITACSSINFEGRDFKALVFDFMQNENLESWLHPSEDTTRKLNLIQRFNIAIDVVSALEYLHLHCETPIVRCDLKPSNVLLDEDMVAHVGDFGLAKFLARNTSNPTGGQTNSIAIKGSIGYIAPEYGMGGSVSKPGDIYSYGILLLLGILTGKRPTDEMFKDGLSLHSFCKMALPERVMEIADPCLLIPEEDLDDQINECSGEAKMRECLISLVMIGVACSTETPNERMSISEIVMELNAIKQVFLITDIHREKRVRIQLEKTVSKN
ncbi:hypothetical protein ACOSQ2_032520 [Xanthoceras sorbifolium]